MPDAFDAVLMVLATTILDNIDNHLGLVDEASIPVSPTLANSITKATDFGCKGQDRHPSSWTDLLPMSLDRTPVQTLQRATGSPV